MISTCFRQRESIVDEHVEAGIDTIQRLAERKGQNGIIGGEHRHRGTEDPRFQPREEARHLPAVRRDEVTIGPWWPKDQPFRRKRRRS